MSDFVLKYADARGEVHSQTAQGTSAQEIRERYTQQGFLVYSVKPKGVGLSLSGEIAIPGRRRKLNLEKFLIFNQQFVTLIRAGLPILKALDLLAERLTDPKLTPYINAVREEVRKGALLSEAFRQQGIFPKIYVTSVMAGEKSGSLVEVLERYITYQKLALGGAQEGAGFADVSVRADRAGDPADGVSGHVRGAQFRDALFQHVGATAHDHAVPDCHRHHGAHLRAALCGGAGRARRCCSIWWSAQGERRRRRSTASRSRFRSSATSGSSTRWRSFRAC